MGPMHIGIDGGCWNNRRGYGRYLRELLRALANSSRSHRYTLFLETLPDFPLPDRVESVLVGASQSVAEGARSDGRRSIGDLLRMSLAVARHKLDLLFFPSVYSYFPLIRPVPMVLGIHDTIADRNPHFAFASKRQELFWRWKVRLGIFQADTILTVSHYSKRCVEEWLRVPSSQIRVVHEAASPVFRKLPGLGGTGNFLLYVGGISPNKNLPALVRAFALLPNRDGLKLMLVGDYKNDGFKGCYQELTTLVGKLDIADQVLFPGYVPDEELCALYNQAKAFVLPSVDEGFGLPVLEAMACGAPVVIGGGSAMEEVAGGAAVVVDARDEAALGAALGRMLVDAPYRQELGRKSLLRAAEFSWDAAARALIAVFEEAR